MICAFQDRSLEIVTPKSLASVTTFMHSPPITTGGKSWLTETEEMRSSLHLSVFSLTLFLLDQFATSSAIVCALLTYPLLITSDVVVSSTYFQSDALLIARSLIMNNHGPSLVPWGTPEGTVPHSDTQLSESLILCERPERKSMIQLVTLGGIVSARNFLTKMLWSIKSKAFL